MPWYVRKRSPRKQALDRAEDKADARRIAGGAEPWRRQKYHSPKLIAAAKARGEPNIQTDREAARKAYKQSKLSRRVSDRYPTVEIERHRQRRSRVGRVAGGRKFSLKRANVSRSKTTGQFIKRAAR